MTKLIKMTFFIKIIYLSIIFLINFKRLKSVNFLLNYYLKSLIRLNKLIKHFFQYHYEFKENPSIK